VIRIGGRLFEGRGPFFMGVVNATPDSFSDGGRYLDAGAAIAQARRLVAEGADLVDVGGESTRPGAAEVPEEEEIRRVVPIVSGLRAAGCTVPISVDTRKAAVARAALDAGADLVNDVSGLGDAAMAGLLRDRGCPVVLMHMRGTPADMAQHAVYEDVVSEVKRELEGTVERAVRAGIPEERIVLDPGLGFAKGAGHNVALLARLGELRALGRPLLVGPSRKSFIGQLTGASAADRLPGTLAAVTACVLAGVEFLRVHDVAPARQAGTIAAAIREASDRARAG
jgi:dihydropteroate synthase